MVSDWRTASYSIGNGACVQVGHGPAVIGVRDSTLRGGGPVLQFPPAAWAAFTARLAATPSPTPT